MRDILRRPQARQDLIDAADFIAAHSGFDASDLFLTATEAAFKHLAALPGLGSARRYGPQFPEMRMWPVPRTRYLVFYLATDDSVEIIRVLHGAQNIPQISTLLTQSDD